AQSAPAPLVAGAFAQGGETPGNSSRERAQMNTILAQLLNGLDKGGAYALIALGLTLVFGTLGVVNFAHGALFMLGCFCAVTLRYFLTLETVTLDPTQLSPWGAPMEVRTPIVENWFGEFGHFLVDYSVPLSILLVIPVMLVIGIAMERGLIKHFRSEERRVGKECRTSCLQRT